ncbi:MAG TPA: PAS domain S-box protein [Terriglobales bacterium]|nr:PAS domain S-box protein [Terriglobales bacterium]
MASVAESRDIQQARQALEESEARRQALLDSALDCIICTDEQTRIIDFNAAAERTFRIPRFAVLGRDLSETILPAELRDRHRRELFVCGASDGIAVIGNRLETKALRSDGTEFPAELTVTSIVIHRKPTFTVYVRDITARKRAEEAVVWLAAIVESSQDAIIGKNLDGRITSWNKGAQSMYGYAADDMIGKNITLLIPPGSPDEGPRILAELKAGRRIENFETVRIAKNGNLVDVSLTVSPVLDPDGSIIGGSSIARDITARKAGEEALRKANETSVYASPIPIIAADAQSHVTIWNPAAEKLFGWREEEVIGRPNPIISQPEAAAAAALHQRLISGDTLTGVEVHRQKRDGSLVAISLSATPLWDASNRVRGIIGFLTDITERKRAEEALRAAEEKYRGIFENALEGVYQCTPDGKYFSANPALARMFGFDSPQELIDTRNDITNQEYVTPQSRADFVRELENRGVVRGFEYQAYRRDGKAIWVSANAHAVRDSEGRILHFEGTVQDITQSRELEQQLRQMQKIEAVGRLAGGVAHDFNNILMAISSYAELMYGKTPENDTRRRYIEEISKATDRAASLTQGLLAFSRKQVISPRVLDLNALIAQQSEMLKRLIPENIELRFVPGDALGRVKVDPGQVEQIVMNLVINARDATPSGGTILIETSNAELSPTDCGLQTPAQSGSYTMIAVSDNGCGMSAETQAQIFEPFFTTKEQGKGTGLGLAIVFGIVKQSNGYIFLHSEPGRGSTFKIYLPRVEAAAQTDDSENSDVSFRGNETILLVEDEDAVRESASEYLAENGYNVLRAKHGPAALEIAEQHPRPIHLMLTDLIMPQMSGRELSERISSIHPETKVLFMSGYSDNLLSNEQVLDPKHVLLQKPFRLSTLGKRITEMLGRGNAASASA